jgi:hypothetical protein
MPPNFNRKEYNRFYYQQNKKKLNLKRLQNYHKHNEVIRLLMQVHSPTSNNSTKRQSM